MRIRQLIFLILVAALVLACTSLNAAGPTPTPPPATPTPTPTPYGGGAVLACYYVWASQELPTLSRTVQESLQSVAAGASGSAYAYGEDCVSADGTRKFTAMETDFRVRLPVDDLTNEKHLGDLTAASMQVIIQIPKEQLVGPKAGRVEFEFDTASAGSLHLTVDIDRFRREATSLSGARLFRLFYVAP